MTLRKILPLAIPLLASAFAPAWAESKAAPHQQYISDDVGATLRTKPANDASSIGLLHAGTPVSVLEVLGPDSFAHVRTGDGRDGWITAHFLTDQASPKEQVQELRQQLEQARAEAQAAQRDLQAAQQQIAKVKPALDMAADNEQLRAAITERERAASTLEQRFSEESARRRTLMAGGILVGGGLLLGLLLPMLVGSGRKRRYSDL